MLCPRIFTAKWPSLIPYSHLFLPSGRWSGVVSAAYSSLARRSLLMNQFDKVKAQFADYIVLFQVGDFYELYGEDASKHKLLTKYAPCIEHRAIFLSTPPPQSSKLVHVFPKRIHCRIPLMTTAYLCIYRHWLQRALLCDAAMPATILYSPKIAP